MRYPSISIIVPARNEEGMIEEVISRIPKFPAPCEVIFVEGHSTDGTLEAIEKAANRSYPDMIIRYAKQVGKGKADAVWTGFEMARHDLLVILDADLTVPPEDLLKFYEALRLNPGCLINGSRLTFTMEPGAMRRFNYLGNKFFAKLLGVITGNRFTDTLCGTKMLSRSDFAKISHLSLFTAKKDPFGDFTLLLGADRLGMLVHEVPIVYRRRRYGGTKIRRFRDGWILLCFVFFHLYLKFRKL